MAYEMQTVDVAQLVLQCLELTQPFADAHNVTLEAQQIDENSSVLADPKRLEQVVTNLLSNAAKFSFEGGVVSICVKVIDAKVRIEVEDQGIGLSETDHDKVFDRFSQLDFSDQRRVGGTGLGMNISKTIVDAHGGIISYSKNKGQGTTFFVEMNQIEVPFEGTGKRTA